MTESPPARPLADADAGQLRLLVRLHLAAAGLSAAGLGLLWWHYSRMHAAFLDVTAWKKEPGGGASLEQFFSVFAQFYLVAAAILGVCTLGNLASGLFIRRRRHWLISVAVATFDCLVVPVGTILGAFTLVVLLRESVRADYVAAGARNPSADATRRDPAGSPGAK